VFDIDVLAGLIGGWRKDFFAASKLPGGTGALALRHCARGRTWSFHNWSQATTKVRASMKSPRRPVPTTSRLPYWWTKIHQLRLREKRPANEIEARVQTILEDPSSNVVERIGQHLAQHLANRPQAIQIDTTGLDEDETYALLLRALDDNCGPADG